MSRHGVARARDKQGPRDERRQKGERQDKLIPRELQLGDVSTWSPWRFMSRMEHFKGDALAVAAKRHMCNMSSRSIKGTVPVAREAVLVANDALECAHVLHTRYRRVAVLVMASRRALGGGYEAGAKSQEEDVYRATNISEKHDAGTVLETELSAVTFNHVLVCRGSEGYGSPLLPEPFCIDTISMAAVSHPAISGDGADERMDGSSTKLMEDKLAIVMDRAAFLQCDALVLGAWGCGVYACPPRHIALMFKTYMAKRALLFDVYIAIPATGAKSRANLAAFAAVFKLPRVMRLLPRYHLQMAAITFMMCFNRGAMAAFLPRDVARIIVRYILDADTPLHVEL